MGICTYQEHIPWLSSLLAGPGAGASGFGIIGAKSKL